MYSICQHSHWGIPWLSAVTMIFCRQDGMMKMRLETNIYGYPLRLVLLFKLACSDVADLISRCWNSNEESCPGFSVFSVFQAKGHFRRKNCKTFLSSVAHKTWLKRYIAVIMGSFWSLRAKDCKLRAKLKCYPWCLARNSFWISKIDILKKTKKLAIFKSMPLPFGSVYFNGTFGKWSFICY